MQMANAATKEHSTLAKAKALSSKLIEIRRHIHAHPELSFQERETSRLVTGILCDLGYEVRPGIGSTGVMADIGQGRTVMIRADMDALPIDETNQQPYCSKNNGVMHACGHDVHVTCALGAAMLVAENPPGNGRIRFLFQPAEETVNDEGKSGARLVIEQGATEGAEAVFALHVDPRLPTGQIAVREGPLLAACDSFNLSIGGIGCHGAYPQYGIDAIVLAAQVVQGLQTIVSRRKSALDPAIVTVGGIRSKTYAPNIIAEEVEITGTVRYFEPRMHELIKEEFHRVCRMTEALGGSYNLQYINDNPAVINDPQLANLVRYVGAQVLGQENVIAAGQEMGGDDFSFLSNHMPGCYFLLGTLIEGDPRRIHTPTFDVDERAIALGTALLAETAQRYLAS